MSPPVPVRGIPFKIICFIGLNNDVFPRKDSFMGFDLLGEAYKAGDRNKKETDKYLFLDTLLAAREKFYISYTGESAKDNTEIPPSVVIDTLLDYTMHDEILVKHPLHGFSEQYNNPAHNRLFTYLYANSSTPFAGKEMEPKAITEIRLRDFIRFFQAPVDWYFNTVLNIYYKDQEEALPETELFEPDNLQRWALKKKFLHTTGDAWEQYIQKAIKEGELPLKTCGLITERDIREEMKFLVPAFRRETGGRTPSAGYIDYTAGQVRITGDVDSLFEREYIACSVSKNPLKNKIEAYITSLLLLAAGKIDTARFIDINGNVSLIPSNQTTAKQELADLTAILLQGTVSPILFTVKSAEELHKCKPPVNADEPTIRKILSAIEREAYPPERSEMPANPYLLRLIEEGALDNSGAQEFEIIRTITAKLKLFDF
ncbi:MAG: hypothetical protein HC905_12685 [Bacteroidales bacterium]|nr:hypothetical protein [Bacteroidales bacterium]